MPIACRGDVQLDTIKVHVLASKHPATPVVCTIAVADRDRRAGIGYPPNPRNNRVAIGWSCASRPSRATPEPLRLGTASAGLR